MSALHFINVAKLPSKKGQANPHSLNSRACDRALSVLTLAPSHLFKESVWQVKNVILVCNYLLVNLTVIGFICWLFVFFSRNYLCPLSIFLLGFLAFFSLMYISLLNIREINYLLKYGYVSVFVFVYMFYCNCQHFYVVKFFSFFTLWLFSFFPHSNL